MRTKILALLFIATIWGCGDVPRSPAPPEQPTDDEGAVQLEGAEVSAALDGTLESAAFTTPNVFERLALMWDAPVAGALELRASLDDGSWTAWQAPIEVFAEDGSFAGHIDLPQGAQHFQFRALGAEAVPTWVTFVTLDTIPVPVDSLQPSADEEEEVADDAAPDRGGAVTIHSRASWGARQPKCVTAMTPYRATVHHTVTPTNDPDSPEQRLRAIQAFHMDSLGWCDIGYNYLVSRDGRVWMGRGKNHLGAHVMDHNAGNVGISFMGTYSSTKITQTQRCHAAALLRYLHAHNPAIALTRSDIKGHRQYNSTECPGNALYGQLNGLVALAHDGGCN